MSENIFVSYSWDNEMHKDKVLSFVDFLRQNGFNVNYDELEMQKETTLQFKEMMLTNLQNATKVIIILSEGYKNKADDFKGGVGSEYRYIIEDLGKNKTKYVLVSFDNLTNDLISKITPAAFIGREIVDIEAEKANDYHKLFSKLMDDNLIEISPVAPTKPMLKKKIIPKFGEPSDVDNASKDKNLDIDMFDDPAPFFDYRLAKAFPGTRGGKWFNNPQEAIERLKILLREPLQRKKPGMIDPIWWFRGSSCLDIDHFEVVNSEKCIIGVDECLVDRIYVYRSSFYYRSFIYVELKPEQPTGIYDDYEEIIKSQVGYYGYANEEYGLYKNHPVTRSEYDDGAAFIDGKYVEFKGEAQLRIRYLTKYNFIICSKFNPINSSDGDALTKKCLDSLIKDDCKIEDLVEIIEKLPKHRSDS